MDRLSNIDEATTENVEHYCGKKLRSKLRNMVRSYVEGQRVRRKQGCPVCNDNCATGEVLMKDDESKERWGQSFNMLMNKENKRVETEERAPSQAMPRNISEEEAETALKEMICGKAVGADEIPAEA